MSRATVCFSMYSDMSMRTIARSSSKRNSASARASSVLPTPVGPRNMNEPIGRFGSDSPARDRRIAFATALGALLVELCLLEALLAGLDREDRVLLGLPVRDHPVAVLLQ